MSCKDRPTLVHGVLHILTNSALGHHQTKLLRVMCHQGKVLSHGWRCIRHTVARAGTMRVLGAPAGTSGYMSPEAQLLREEQVRAQTMLEHESVAHLSMKRKHAEAEQEARAWPHPHSGFRIDCTISLCVLIELRLLCAVKSSRGCSGATRKICALELGLINLEMSKG